MPIVIAALIAAVAYLIGAGGNGQDTWSTPTTAVGTVAPATVASIPTAAPPVTVVQVTAASPRTGTTELAALLAAEDELAERSATVVARATERAERKGVPVKVVPVKAASATAPAKAEQKAAKAAGKAAEKAEKAEQKATAKTERAAQKAAAKSSKAKTPGAVKAPSNAELEWRIDQVAEDTCERHAGGIVAEDYTCVSPDFHSKHAS